MTHPTAAKRAEYQFLIQTKLKGVLTPAEIAKLQTDGAVNLIQAQSAGDGSTDVVATAVAWIKTYPKFFKYSTDTSKESFTDSQLVYNGGLTFAAAARELPETYRALHAETVANEPALDGLFALRSNGVDVAVKDDEDNLTAASGSGTALTDSNVMGFYTSWGAAKYKAIMSKGAIASIVAETDTNYDTLAEVVAVYDAYSASNQVPIAKFFEALDTMTRGGVTIKFSELYAYRNDLTNFNKFTSPAAIKLMASSGGSFATVSGLTAQKFADLTSTNAVKAMTSCGATYTSMNTVYTASTDKFGAMMTDNSVSLCAKGYSGIDFSGLSTQYGTTYTPATKKAYLDLVEPTNHDLFANGVTLAHVAAAVTAGKDKCFTPALKKIIFDSTASAVTAGKDKCFTPALKKIIFDSTASADTIYNDLVTATGSSNFAGLEDIGFGPC